MQILPGVPEAIALLSGAGFCVIVVTNQRCVAKGLLTVLELDLMHRRMCRGLATSGAEITEVYYCPHEKHPPCSCRKPAPGMLLEAARAHEINLAGSWMIGDSDVDVQAGRSAGCRTARILRSDQTAVGAPDVFAQSLLDAVHQVLLLES
jgi:histidinol-phosphate phosphatase family protein